MHSAGFGRKYGVRDRGKLGRRATGSEQRCLWEGEREKERTRRGARREREDRGLVFVIGGAKWRSI